MTQGQRAMAGAMIYPEPAKRGRGNKIAASGEFSGVSMQHLPGKSRLHCAIHIGKLRWRTFATISMHQAQSQPAAGANRPPAREGATHDDIVAAQEDVA